MNRANKILSYRVLVGRNQQFRCTSLAEAQQVSDLLRNIFTVRRIVADGAQPDTAAPVNLK